MGKKKKTIIPKKYWVTFAMVTSLFALWGFGNDITNPMVAAFKNVLLISHFQSSLVMTAFYGGYCLMAIPAALFIRKYSYRRGVLVGLALYASGCFLFIPAGINVDFNLFLLSYLVLTCGLSFLETSSNPFILSLGDAKTATRRLNIAQAFNPCGAILGMLTASEIILTNLSPATEAERQALQASDLTAFSALQQSDISTIIVPYICLGVFVTVVLLVFLFVRMPEVRSSANSSANQSTVVASVKRLFRTPRYTFGIIVQFFYVGLQICCWTFIIQYAGNELGIDKATAERWNIGAMIFFVTFRFICTWLMKYIAPGKLLSVFAVCGICTVTGAILLPGYAGLFSLVTTSSFMSLMFPTIYGLALDGHGEDAKLGSAGLIFAIGGGAIFPPIMGSIMDGPGFAGLDPTRSAFVVPIVCFCVICVYGICCYRGKKKQRVAVEKAAA